MSPRGARQHGSPREQLIRATQRGGITLVLGAGISMPRGIPDWNTLARKVWQDVFPDKPHPWSRQPGSSPKELPQFLPIIFELAYHKLGEARFFETLQKYLYQHAKSPVQDSAFARSKESLAVLARLMVAEHNRGAGRRITSVITLNADDFIEQAVARVCGVKDELIQTDVVGAINRSTHRLLAPAPKEPIPIYHVHGFLPSELWHAGRGPKRMLVFTDLQYWSTSATGSSFANRVVSSALSEGQCIFIGVSMRDINLLRWLALRTLERERDQIDFSQERLLRWVDNSTANQIYDVRERLIKIQESLRDPLLSRVRAIDKAFEEAEMSDAYEPFRGQHAIDALLDVLNDLQESLKARSISKSGAPETGASHSTIRKKERTLRRIAGLTTDQAMELLRTLNVVRATVVDPMGSASRSLDNNFRRHFWIRPSSIDPSGFLSDFLATLRGVHSVEIDGWRGDSFEKLIRSCFPAKSRRH